MPDTAKKPEPESTRPQPIQDAKKESPKKFRRFIKKLRRHNRVLTFVGALVVFGTFIMKDIMRENFKDLVDSLDKAESIYLVRADIRHLETKLYTPQGDPRQLLKQQLEQSLITQQGGLDALLKHGNRIRDENNSRSLELENILEFSAKLHSHEIEDLKRNTQLARVSLDNELQQWRDDLMKSNYDSETPGSRNHLLAVTLPKMWEEERRLDTHIDALERAVLEEGRKLKSKNEYWYKIATRASYFFYGLGWALGLFGRLVDVKTGAEE